jgi:hypothetical protein
MSFTFWYGVNCVCCHNFHAVERYESRHEYAGHPYVDRELTVTCPQTGQTGSYTQSEIVISRRQEIFESMLP